MKQYAAREGVTEQLKAEDQMEWVSRMNSIRERVEETVVTELIQIMGAWICAHYYVVPICGKRQ